MKVLFSHRLEAVSAANPSNNSIDNGVSVASATIAPDMKTVTLTVLPKLSYNMGYLAECDFLFKGPQNSATETLAIEAVEKLYTNGIFKGHPGKPYYQSNDGVRFLLYALLELQEPDVHRKGAF